MADYVLARKTRNIASSAVHVFLNILLGITTVLITVFSGSPVLGILLVLISKWRIVAVRRRYLWLNIKSNLVDLIVGLSIVLLAFYAGSSLSAMHFVLMALYVVWLIVIKPMSSEQATLAQSLTAVFLGISASSIMTASLDQTFGVVLAFLIEAYDEEVVDAEKNDTRVVLRFHPALAPFKAAVLPLSKKLSEPAREVYNVLCKEFMVDFDETGSIGKRYRRQDEIGTPYCITVDFDTVGDGEKEGDGCVTVRERDSMEQVRLPISALCNYLREKTAY